MKGFYMSRKKTFDRLRNLGYDRAENYGIQIQYKTIRRDDFKGKSLNHTIMEHVILDNCDFEETCATGSIFRHCKFINCNINQADFEFCEFYDCEFDGRNPVNCSFNNSSFFNTVFRNVMFRGCTFTGGLFHECYWNKGNIINSTLEGANFRKCTFQEMDLRYLNMDYIELEDPKMQDVILPLDQVPFIFGALQYLIHTNDSVKISKNENGSITMSRYFNEIIPLLCEHFSNTEQYFPLANIYLALGNKDEGFEATKKGLISAMAIRDFRMIKYFCKLIAYSKIFKPGALHNLYNNYICRLFPDNEAGLAMPNYSRQLLEIKELLFSSPNKSSFHIALKTDIRLSDNHKLGKLFESIFSIGKQHGTFQGNDIKAVLQQNSPLIITIYVTGDELQLASLLVAYLSLAGISVNELQSLPGISKYYKMLPEQSGHARELEALAHVQRQELQNIAVNVSLIEYYIENFQWYTNRNEPIYYFNSKVASRTNALMG